MKEKTVFKFNPQFKWGVSTSSYQIEGACDEDGKGKSIWDTYTHMQGRILDGSNGDVACDSYHRLEEDLNLLQELGVNAYRFSIAWTRILPNGIGEVNQKGIDYYNRLIDGLVERNITPFVTLYHWDLPQALQDKGGFLSDEFPTWFLEYTKVVASAFGDRVKHFFTFNEPQCALHDYFAPGITHSKAQQLVRIHHMLLAHGLSARELHKIDGAKVGYASCGMTYIPATDNQEDYLVAKEKFFKLDVESPVDCTIIYSEPIFKGKYPDEYYQAFKEILPKIGENDMQIIAEPLDFWAQNVYDGCYVKAVKTEDGKLVAQTVAHPFGDPLTLMGWHIAPKAVYYAVKYVYEKYQKPIYIAENGISLPDLVFSDGNVHDPLRKEFLHLYLRELEKISNDGAEVLGYFHWSFLDNFEWNRGYTQRFGLVHVDFQTLKRTKKDSFYAYQDIISASKN